MSEPLSTEENPSNPRRKQWLTGLGVGLAVIAIGSGLYYYLVARWNESTEDAYANGNVIQISAQIPGTVVAIHADNNDLAKTGEVLAELDPSDARVTLKQAEANLARTVRQVRGLYANVGSLKAEVNSRRAVFERAQADYERRKGLAVTGAIPAEELAHAREALTSAKAR